jgi:poly-gamma-glutamate capsule biosynthesis protein CapA/YwtB (metallophosphatase superfamily)
VTGGSGLLRAGGVSLLAAAASISLLAAGCTPPLSHAGSTDAGPGTTAPIAAPAGTTSAPTVSAPAPSPVATSAPVGQPVTLAFAGDVHFEAELRARLRDPRTALAPVAAALSAPDLTVVNLESAITGRGTPEPKKYHFRAPPSALTALDAAGVDVVTMANNHAVDYGRVGLADTLQAIRRSPVPVVGIGRDDAAALTPYVANIRGTRVAVLGATQVPDRTAVAWAAGPAKAGVAVARDPARLLRAVRAARAVADVVVVYLHWGTERVTCPTPEQRGLARRLAAAGADIVVGSHAHVQLGAGWLGRTHVGYGLGNFVWYSPNSAAEATTGVLTLTVSGRRVTAQRWTPASIGRDGLPRLRRGTAADRAVAAWQAARGCTGLAARPG